MKLLLDTHSFLWFIEDHPALSERARILIDEPSNEVFLSIASVWEMAIKLSLGKLHVKQPFNEFIPSQLRRNNILPLDISIKHVLTVAELPFHYRDPFDRLLVAQSLVEGYPIISADAALDAYHVARQW